jgi:hypothetical protein
MSGCVNAYLEKILFRLLGWDRCLAFGVWVLGFGHWKLIARVRVCAGIRSVLWQILVNRLGVGMVLGIGYLVPDFCYLISDQG